MIDCGCTTTSIRSYGTPNRWCASISSSPLFISVAESIVILPPMSHVGCASASSRRDGAQLVGAAAAERARRTRSARAGRPCPGARRRSADGAPSARSRPGSPARRSPRPAPSRARRRRRGSPCSRARGRCPRRGLRSSGRGPADPTSAFSTRSQPRVRDQLDEPLGAGQDRRRRSTPRRRAPRPSSSASAIRSTPNVARLLDDALPRGLRGEPDDLELVAALDDVERLHADRAGRAEDEDPAHRASVASPLPRVSS